MVYWSKLGALDDVVGRELVAVHQPGTLAAGLDGHGFAVIHEAPFEIMQDMGV
eukprot:CAMPEP_0202095428 /NCGR_PEP_ID=MMETSP0964-20121228/49539_1 /ASSEMBLY_ACC=CAM_ASM_000500 /TAXON_ID=4773 /ORGANISM="Schizochytrium aggregatum, Strain ATCC28209" /LENGTH=52 /DNA_ID=CAMNT_0048663683 /DNA_START=952 /DNA_END=1110 /DNA_ORIENTATION=-